MRILDPEYKINKEEKIIKMMMIKRFYRVSWGTVIL